MNMTIEINTQFNVVTLIQQMASALAENHDVVLEFCDFNSETGRMNIRVNDGPIAATGIMWDAEDGE